MRALVLVSRERSRFIARECEVDFLHYDFHAQALAKIERDHPLDRLDVHAMLERALVEPAQLAALFESISAQLHRYPAIDPARFRRLVAQATARP